DMIESFTKCHGREPVGIYAKRYLASDLQATVELIQAPIPIGSMAVAEELEREVERLVGARYSRQAGLCVHCVAEASLFATTTGAVPRGA
ncbi:hypothetical protein ACFL0Q_09105, partial [Thermodesulfobacteriota bacterium]